MLQTRGRVRNAASPQANATAKQSPGPGRNPRRCNALRAKLVELAETWRWSSLLLASPLLSTGNL